MNEPQYLPRVHVGYIEEYFSGTTASEFGRHLGNRIASEKQQELGTEGRQVIRLSEDLHIKKGAKEITLRKGMLVTLVVWPLQGRAIQP